MNQDDLNSMSQVDIRTVDKNSLVDIGKIKINKKASKNERLCHFIQEIRNPYCYICNGVIVKSNFDEQGETLERTLAELISRMGENEEWLHRSEEND